MTFSSSLFYGLALSLLFLASCQTSPLENKDGLSTLFIVNEDLTASAIMQNAHKAAGGEVWRRPQSLYMSGYAVFYKDGRAMKHERHQMWRVYDAQKRDAHQVDGKVRIKSQREGIAVINISYDGKATYTAKGPQPKSEGDKRWASNFGFGVIRHALDEGYSLNRLPDDLIDDRAVYLVEVIDPMGGKTQFGIAQDNYAILKVGFDTPRGWHERIYSNFFSNPNETWVQPGRVRLYYDGVKGNEVIWTSYTLNQNLPNCLFILPERPNCYDSGK